MRGDRFGCGGEQLSLSSQGAFAGMENDGFLLFQVGSDVALFVWRA